MVTSCEIRDISQMLKTAATHRKPARVTADVEPPVDSNPRPFLYEGNALPLSYRGTYAFVPNRPKAADEQCIPRNSTKKAGERLITFSTVTATESRRQRAYGVHCIHPVNPPEDRECSGQRHTINPIPTAANRASPRPTTTDTSTTDSRPP